MSERVQRLAPGVYGRWFKNSSQLYLRIKIGGVSQKIVLPNRSPDNPRDIAYAELKARTIREDSRHPGFDITGHLPRKDGATGIANETVISGLQRWRRHLERHSGTKAQLNQISKTIRCIETYSSGLGKTGVLDLRAEDLCLWISRQTKTTKAMNTYVGPIRAMLDWFVENHPSKIQINVAKLDSVRRAIRALDMKTEVQRNGDYVEVAMPAKSRRAIDPFDVNELERIIAAAYKYHESVGNMITLAAFTGLRLEEVFALKPRHLRLDQKTLLIQDTNTSSEARVLITKTNESRQVVLLPRATEALEQQVKLRGDIQESAFLFLRVTRQAKGRPYLRSDDLTGTRNEGGVWQTIIANAEVRYRPPSQLRHTYASNLLLRGEDKSFVKDQLGHRSFEMLDRHYHAFIQGANAIGDYQWSSNYGQIKSRDTSAPRHEQHPKAVKLEHQKIDRSR